MHGGGGPSIIFCVPCVYIVPVRHSLDMLLLLGRWGSLSRRHEYVRKPDACCGAQARLQGGVLLQRQQRTGGGWALAAKLGLQGGVLVPR
jgi:hypothetical protein